MPVAFRVTYLSPRNYPGILPSAIQPEPELNVAFMFVHYVGNLDSRIDQAVIDPCLLDCVGHAVCGVDIDAARDTRLVFRIKVVAIDQNIHCKTLMATNCFLLH